MKILWIFITLYGFYGRNTPILTLNVLQWLMLPNYSSIQYLSTVNVSVKTSTIDSFGYFFQYPRFDVLAPLNVKNTVVSIVSACCQIEVYGYFGGTNCLHFQVQEEAEQAIKHSASCLLRAFLLYLSTLKIEVVRSCETSRNFCYNTLS